MSDVRPGAVSPGDDGDDDALADAILASYTSSIPIVRPSATPLHPGAELDDDDPVDQEPVAQPEPVSAPEPVAVSEPADFEPEPIAAPDAPIAEPPLSTPSAPELLTPEPLTPEPLPPEPLPPEPPTPEVVTPEVVTPEPSTAEPLPAWAPESPVSPTPWWETVGAEPPSTEPAAATPEPTVGQPIPWWETAAGSGGPTSAADDSVWDLAEPAPGADGTGGTIWDLSGTMFAPTPPAPEAAPGPESRPMPDSVFAPEAPVDSSAPESFDFPPPEDEGTPIDLSGSDMPQPWTEFPAPAPDSMESDGETWPHPTDEPVTPFSPRPFPTEERESWTTIAQPKAPQEDAPADPNDSWPDVEPDRPAFATAPPPTVDSATPLAPTEPPFDETLLGTYVDPTGQSPIDDFLRTGQQPAPPAAEAPPVDAPFAAGEQRSAIPPSEATLDAPSAGTPSPVAVPPGIDPVISVTPADLAAAPPPNPDSAVDFSILPPPTGQPAVVPPPPIDSEPSAPATFEASGIAEPPDAPWNGAPAPDFTPPTLVEPPPWSPVTSTVAEVPLDEMSREGDDVEPADQDHITGEPKGASPEADAIDTPPVVSPFSITDWDAMAGDANYADDDDGSVDQEDRAWPLTPLPPGTVQTTILSAEPLPSIPAPVTDVAPPVARPLGAFTVETAGLEPTALEQRTGRAARMFWLWFAANASALSIGVGAVVLLLGLSLRQAMVATLVGAALSFLPIGFTTLAGKWSGQPTLVVSRATFGLFGNLLPTVIGVVTRAVWGGILLWLAASAVGAIIAPTTPIVVAGPSVALVAVLIAVVLAAVIAVVGYGLVARVQLVLSIVTAVLVVGLIALTVPEVDLGRALDRPDGPWALVIAGAVLVFSYLGLAWVQSGSDVARYQRPSRRGSSNMLWASFGATLPAFALIAWGAILAASSPSFALALVRSPVAALASVLPSWYPIPLLLAAGLGAVAGAVISIYSGGFAVLALGAPLRRSLATLVAAVLAGAVGVGLVLVGADARVLTQDVVVTLAVPVAAWAGIFGAEMMIRSRRFHAPSLVRRGGAYPNVRVANLLALIVIAGVGYGLTSATVVGLDWQGYLYPLIGIARSSALAASEIGVLVALVLGLIVPFATGIPSIRRQEALRA